ncbi:MAG: divergent PAP2 family protein [Dehalococcoidales bacterium]|nr:divergent PAP2 family protein [Dehalococcoidales bacterium]
MLYEASVISDLGINRILVISLIAWAIAQVLKVILVFIQERRIAWHFFITSGGMPSSHTATVCALATAIAMTEGVASIYFSISAVLAIIVMYDAAGVRQSVGQHSAVLNRMLKEISFKTSRAELQKNLREFVGHTPLQVMIGALLGIFIAWTSVILSGG